MSADSGPISDIPTIAEEPVKISPDTALEMVKGLLGTVNTLVDNLPEFEVRKARRYLENTVQRADLLIAGFDGLPLYGNPLPKATNDGPEATRATDIPAKQSAVGKESDILLSVRPKINQPDYTGHPAFIRPGMPLT
jgi:hypothetical protein